MTTELEQMRAFSRDWLSRTCTQCGRIGGVCKCARLGPSQVQATYYICGCCREAYPWGCPCLEQALHDAGLAPGSPDLHRARYVCDNCACSAVSASDLTGEYCGSCGGGKWQRGFHYWRRTQGKALPVELL